VLGALEVARPELQLVGVLGWPVIPVDTVRALYKNPGLVKAVHYRPSSRTVFKQRLDGLNGEEVAALARVMSDPSATFPPELSAKAQVRVMDTALDLVDSKYSRELVKSDAERDADVAQLKQALLERRAKMLVVSDKFEVERPVRETPHIGHASTRLGLGAGYERAHGFDQRLSLRLALHDLGDPPRGYPDSTEIEFLPLELRYFVEDPRLWLEYINLIRVRSLTPWTEFAMPISWGVRVGASRMYDEGGNGHLAAQFELGGGGTVAALDSAITLYLLGTTEISALAPIDGGIADLPLRAGVGPDAGVRLRLGDHMVALFGGRWLYLPTQTPRSVYRATGSLRYEYESDFAVSLDGRLQPEERSVSLSSFIYF
jgi:hypothetical protein